MRWHDRCQRNEWQEPRANDVSTNSLVNLLTSALTGSERTHELRTRVGAERTQRCCHDATLRMFSRKQFSDDPCSSTRDGLAPDFQRNPRTHNNLKLISSSMIDGCSQCAGLPAAV